MRSLSSFRGIKALARYHLLSTIRSAHGVIAISFLAALGATALFGAAGVFARQGVVAENLRLAALLVHVVYVLHLFVIVIGSDLLAGKRRQSDRVLTADLTETVPVTPVERFFGDALGVLACTMVIHVCTLPVLAFVVALSPLSPAVLVWLELLVIAVAVLGAAGAAWSRRAEGRWERTRTGRSLALFGILFVLILATNTRWEHFRDAAAAYLYDPSPQRWSHLTGEVMNPPMLVSLLAALYLGYFLYYAMNTIRSLQRN